VRGDLILASHFVGCIATAELAWLIPRNDGMSDEPKKRRSWAPIGWTLAVVLVLYPLSIGPADCILGRCSGHPRISAGLLAAYYPISSICEKSATLKAIFVQYLVLWHRVVGDGVH
jgi:hypothetical protein